MWLVYAINKYTKEIAGFYIGKRNNKTLNSVVKTLINSKAEKIYTDKLRSYLYLIPKKIHSTKSTEPTDRKKKPQHQNSFKKIEQKNNLF